jgi:hypothetical protein
MGQDPGTVSAAVTDSEDPQQLEREIEEARQDLGDTVEALAAKADVKGQAKRRFEESKASVEERTAQLVGKARDASPDSAARAASQVSERARDNPVPLAAAGAFLAGFLAGRLSRR